MVNYRRNVVPGGTYFFTVTLADRSSRTSFARGADLAGGRRRFPGRWRRIKGYFSKALLDARVPLRRASNGELALWQRRYWEHTIRDDQDFARHVDYIHFNPVKHGLVSRVRDWEHSSFHRYVRDGVLPDDWAGDATGHSGNFGERSG